MEASTYEISVKNMVCDRCIKVVRQELYKYRFTSFDVELGKVIFDSPITDEEKSLLRQILEKEGLQLLENRDKIIVNNIKTLVVQNIHHNKCKPDYQNYSDYLSDNLGMEYSQLSKLFSAVESRSIESFVIAQKIERVKELLKYGEMTLCQISYELNYSSPQHLSRQFKQVTGVTASTFKREGKRVKLDTI